jgi:hypothetical protein
MVELVESSEIAERFALATSRMRSSDARY